jgi:hypothetical protein
MGSLRIDERPAGLFITTANFSSQRFQAGRGGFASADNMPFGQMSSP